MARDYPSAQNTVSPERPYVAETHAYGRWLALARVMWVSTVVLALSIFCASLPAYFIQLQTICVSATCVYSYGQLTPGTAQALQNLGLSTVGYAASILALAIVSALVSFVVAGVLFWRRSADWMVMFVSLFLVTFAVNFSAQGLLAANQHTAWNVPLTMVTLLGWTLFNLLWYLFPNGRFVPRWTRPLAVFAVGMSVFLNAYPTVFFSLPSWVAAALFSGIGVSGVVAQIYRYRRVSGPVQRQQTKWVVFGIAATAVVILGRLVPLLIFPSLSASNSLYFLVSTYAYPVGLLLIPLSLGIAILRYRLWDIDTIINRALVYGGLSLLLVAVYLVLIVGLESLVGLVGGQTSQPVVIVVSTLVIAALFQPLRTRIQSTIDRRFYRRKYDAAKTLAGYSATLQSQVDLKEIHDQLLAVVQETMQPTSVSLWLRQPRPD